MFRFFLYIYSVFFPEDDFVVVNKFFLQGEGLMEDPKSPKFLENHVSKLKESASKYSTISSGRRKQTQSAKKRTVDHNFLLN